MKYLKELIAQHEIALFFQEASSIPVADIKWQDDLLLLRARYEQLRRKELQGILSAGESTLEMNKIELACIEWVNQVTKANATPTGNRLQLPAESAHHTFKSSSSTVFKWAYVLVPVALLAMAFVFWQINSFNSNPALVDHHPSKPDSLISNPTKRDTNMGKQEPITVIPPTPKPKPTARGTALRVGVQPAKYESKATLVLQEALDAAGIQAEDFLQGQTYASIIQCEVAVNKETQGEEGAFELKVVVTVKVTNSAGLACGVYRFASTEQVILSEQEEEEWVARGLEEIKTQILAKKLKINC